MQRSRGGSVVRVTPFQGKLLLVLFSTVFALLAVEVAIRVQAALEDMGILRPEFESDIELPSDGYAKLGHVIRLSRNPDIIYELKPDLSALYYGKKMTTNSRGFRCRDIPIQRAENTFRIVGIGDSVMFGKGVADDEVYLTILERRLQASLPDVTVEIVNTAVPGYNTVMEVETLRDKGLIFEPDVVIVDFVGNDLTLPNFIRTERDVLDLRRSFLLDFVRRRREILDSEAVVRRLRREGLRNVPQNIVGGLGRTIDPSQVPERYRHMVGWDGFRRAVQELAGLSEKTGFTVVVTALSAYPGDRKAEAFEVFRGVGFATFDVGAVYKEYLEQHGFDAFLGSPLAVSDRDEHPSALAHAIAAEAIQGYLVRERLVPVVAADSDPTL
jgi:hypothetical protein